MQNLYYLRDKFEASAGAALELELELELWLGLRLRLGWVGLPWFGLAPCCYHVTYVHQRPMFVYADYAVSKGQHDEQEGEGRQEREGRARRGGFASQIYADTTAFDWQMTMCGDNAAYA